MPSNQAIWGFVKKYGIGCLLIGWGIYWIFGVANEFLSPKIEVATCVLDRLTPGDEVTVFGEDYIITTSLHYPALGEAEVRAKRK